MKFGLVPVISFKDPSLEDASEGHLELMKDCVWIAQTAMKVPTVKTKIAGRETPKLSVKMVHARATGPTREEALARLHKEILSLTRGVPELRAEDVEV